MRTLEIQKQHVPHSRHLSRIRRASVSLATLAIASCVCNTASALSPGIQFSRYHRAHPRAAVVSAAQAVADNPSDVAAKTRLMDVLKTVPNILSVADVANLSAALTSNDPLKAQAAAKTAASATPPFCANGSSFCFIPGSDYGVEGVKSIFTNAGLTTLSGSGVTQLRVDVFDGYIDLGGGNHLPLYLVTTPQTPQSSTSNSGLQSANSSTNTANLLDPTAGVINLSSDAAFRFKFPNGVCNFAEGADGHCIIAFSGGLRSMRLNNTSAAGSQSLTQLSGFGEYAQLGVNFLFPIYDTPGSQASCASNPKATSTTNPTTDVSLFGKDTNQAACSAGTLAITAAVEEFHQSSGFSHNLFPDATDSSGKPYTLNKTYTGFSIKALLNVVGGLQVSATYLSAASGAGAALKSQVMIQAGYNLK